MRVWQGEGDFLSLLKADQDVAKALSASELEALFDLEFHTKHVDLIFARVFGAANAVTSPAPGAPAR
jgi:adenylosuccinate lyase